MQCGVQRESVEQRRYPFEVAHVRGDRRSALEGQVADRRRRCAALVVAHVDLHIRVNFISYTMGTGTHCIVLSK